MGCYTEVSTIQRLFYMHGIVSGPIKVVCSGEVPAVRGVCCKRFHSIANLSTKDTV